MTTYISAIGTANPIHQIAQSNAAQFMAEAMALGPVEQRKIRALYRASGIQNRYSVLEDYTKSYGYYTFFPNSENLEPFPSTQDRMKVYNVEAPKLAVAAAKTCLDQLPDFDASSITHLITISCTGMQAPGMDIAMVQELGLRTSVNRTCVYFMGCYAAINGLRLANSICQADANSKVLVVSVELCSLHFQKKIDEDNLLANALFADGAAAVLVEGEKRATKQLVLEQFYCDLATDGLEDMAWHIGDTGFQMRLSSYIPAFIKGGVEQLLQGLLKNIPEVEQENPIFAIHPGGRRILEAAEEALGLAREDNRYSYQVLREYGNMSSATVLFVLKAIFDDAGQQEEGRPIISFAFGPGLTLESMLLRVAN